MLNQKDIEIITQLLKLERRIGDSYREIDKTQDFERLLRLIEAEDALLESLEISEKKLELIEKYLKRKASLYLDNSPLLLGISPHLTRNKYPYYRIIARLRYKMKQKVGIDAECLYTSFKDVEVTTFYRALDNECQNIPDFREETKDSIREELKTYQLQILIDSPKVEIQLLKNSLNPLEIIYDLIDFYIALLLTFGLEEINKLSSELEETLSNKIDLNECTTKERLRWFNSRFVEVKKEIIRHMNISSKDPRVSPHFLMLVAYAKSLIAPLDKRTRLKIYRDFASNESLKKIPFPWFQSWFVRNIEEIETELVGHINKVSTAPKKYL